MTFSSELATIIQIAQLIGYGVVAVIFVVMIKADVKVLKVQMENTAINLKSQIDGVANNLVILNNSFNKLGDILTQVAVQDKRIDRVEDDIRELKHGEGFVRGPTGIDREYGEK